MGKRRKHNSKSSSQGFISSSETKSIRKEKVQPQITSEHVNQQLNLGVQYCQSGKLSEAEACFQQVLKWQPDNPDAWNLLGAIAAQQKQFSTAIGRIERAIKLKPTEANFYNNLGNIYLEQEEFQQAINLYYEAIKLQPYHADTHNNLAVIYRKQGDFPKAMLHQGMAYQSKGQLDRAIEYYQKALQFQSDYIPAHVNLGNVYQKQGLLQKSVECYEKAIELQPDDATCYNNLGNTYKEQKQISQAIDCYEKAIELKPQYPHAHSNLGSTLLLLGEFERGFLENEWRLEGLLFKSSKTKTPMWDGSSLQGKSIILWNEQGLGDFIQFIRYAQKLKQQTTKIILSTHPALVSLLSECLQDQYEVVERSDSDIYAYDCHASILSLPYICKTRFENIPNSNPYIFAPKPLRSHCILPSPETYRIGIVWGSQIKNPDYHKKSCSPEFFIDLLDVGNISLHSLQVGEDAPKIKPWLENERIHDLSPLLKDFVDTACVIEQLDLVITVDTAVAHLAGAMGKPVWVLLPFVPDWRWLLERQDSPWYPTMRLFRQPKRGDWVSMFEQVKEKLKAVLEGESPIFPVEEVKAVSHSIQAEFLQERNSDKLEKTFQLGVTHSQSGKLSEAEICFQQVLKWQPDNAEAYKNLGILYEKQGKLSEAMLNYGIAHQRQEQFQQAIEYYKKAIELKPNYAVAHYNLGHVCQKQNQFQQAIEHYQTAIKLQPDYPQAHQNLGLVLLLCGIWELGFLEYEWRLKNKRFDYLKKLQKSMWDGSPIDGKSIVLGNEQGLGDAIQFVRYASKVREQGVRVILSTPPVLVTLFKSCLQEQFEVLAEDQCNIYDYDCHASLMSLPSIFKTNLDNIPNSHPYIVAPNLRSNFILPPSSDYSIGIVWAAGNLSPELYHVKSCSPELFIDLLDVRNISLYSLQVGEDAPKIKPWLENDRIHDLSPLLKDFVDTACVIEQLDLVITVDTAVAHLAGAMGKPVWVLLPFVPDWRWLLERQDTPWYPTMRLFRQQKRGDWVSVFEQVKEKLTKVLEGESHIFPVEEVKASPLITTKTIHKTNHIFVLNLKRRADRRTAFRQWNCQDDIHYEFIEAIEGRHLHFPDLIKNGLAVKDLKWRSAGALGCTLSHKMLWERCVARDQLFLVCEDDVVLRRDFSTVFPQILQRIPPEWDFILLGYNLDSATSLELFPGVEMHSWFSKKVLEEQDLNVFLQENRKPVVLPLRHAFGLCAYAISPKGAKYLLEQCFPLSNRSIHIPCLRRSVISVGIDYLMNAFYGKMRAFCLVPPLAVSPNNKETSDTS